MGEQLTMLLDAQPTPGNPTITVDRSWYEQMMRWQAEEADVRVVAVALRAEVERLRAAASVDPGQVGGGLTGARHPRQSHAAAATVRVGSQMAAVLIDLLARGDATAWELARTPSNVGQVRPGIASNQVASRMLDLRQRGLIRVAAVDGAQRMRPTATATAAVHELTPAGRIEASRLRAEEASRG